MTYETTITRYRKDHWWSNFLIWLGVLDEECDIPVEVEYDSTPFIRGVTWGPPEKCYPDEGGEVDILWVTSQLNGEEIILDKHEEDKLVEELQQYEYERQREDSRFE